MCITLLVISFILWYFFLCCFRLWCRCCFFFFTRDQRSKVGDGIKELALWQNLHLARKPSRKWFPGGSEVKVRLCNVLEPHNGATTDNHQPCDLVLGGVGVESVSSNKLLSIKERLHNNKKG